MAKISVQNITVFTDASFCPETKAGGGAFWARSHEARLKGAFPIEVARQSHEAEIIAAAEAILSIAEDPVLGKELEKGPATRLILVVDCLNVLYCFAQGRLTSMNPEVRALVDKARAVIQRLGFLVKVNHVKAHKGTGTPRQWVNQWCDEQAGGHMRKMRALRRRAIVKAKREQEQRAAAAALATSCGVSL